MNISKEQLVDAAGQYGDVAQTEGVTFERAGNQLMPPTFTEIKYTLGVESMDQALTLRAADTLKLAAVPQTRVMVGINTPKGAAYLPGIVLPDSTPHEVRFGCLAAPEDMRPSTHTDAVKGLNAFQQILLAKIAAQHQPEVGEHGSDGKLNAADIGHAVVAATYSAINDIHGQVHTLVEAKSLSADIAQKGATNMAFTDEGGRMSGIRQNTELVFNQTQIAGVIIVDAHQLPFPIADEFEVSAGFTLAAQQSRGEAPDLARNFAGMAT